MRIGFDARTIHYRGIGTYSRNLLLRFADTGIKFVVFCQDDKKGDIPSAESFTFVSANMDPIRTRGRRLFRALVERSGVDLLHVPSPWAPTPSPVPLVATVHDVTPLLYPRSVGALFRFRYKRQLTRTLAQADSIITVSRISYSALIANGGVQPAKVRVIYNGVSQKFTSITDPAVLEGVGRRYSLPERFAFWVGDFRPEKNLHFLVTAWQRLQRRLPEPLPLVLAGAQSGEFKRIQREVAKAGLEASVLFPGFIDEDDLPAVYSLATVFIFPSFYEGFGLPPLEAMACETPCVVSSSSSLPEVTGSAALLFNPTSLDNFEECVMRVLTDADLCEQLKCQGKARAAAFSWDRAAAETLNVYRAVLGGNGRSARR